MPLLAQVNVAVLREPLAAPSMSGFVGALWAINELAERSEGFVWRFDAGHHLPVAVVGEGAGQSIVNISLWTGYEALHAFVYRTAHGAMLRRRGRWFAPTLQPSTALWWAADNDRPVPADALPRLARLRAHGPAPGAFSLRRRFEPDGTATVARRGASHRGTAPGRSR